MDRIVNLYIQGHQVTRQSALPFFGAQWAIFILTAIALLIFRPAIIGRLCGGFLMLSTLWLLASSHDASTIVKFLLVALWLISVSSGMRMAIARFIGERFATWGLSAAAVYAALIPTCFLLGLFGAIAPWIVAPLAVATALPGLIAGLRRLPALPGYVVRQLDRMGIVEVSLMQVIWFILAVTFVFAGTSEVLSDAVRVHLPYVHQVAAEHGISHPYACWYLLQTMGYQTCCAAFASLGSDAAAKWFSWFALGALTWLAAEEVYRRSRSTRMAMFAAAALLGCPLLLWIGGSLYVDHVVALLTTAGFVALFRALRPPCLRGILLSAAIMGCMAEVKYNGLVFCAVWGAWLGLALLRQCGPRVALRWSLAGGALLLLVALPWYAYVYAGTGNPVFPYINGWFHSPYWADGFSLRDSLESHFKLSPGIGGVLEFPWIATFDTHRYVEGANGFLGFWVLALIPGWFLARPRRGPRYWDLALAGAAMVGGIALYTPYIRYWLPAYPLLLASCVLAAGSFMHDRRWPTEGLGVKAIWATTLAGLLLLPAPLACLDLPWGEYSGRISREERLAKRFPGYPAVERLNAILQPDDGVLCTAFDGVYLVGGRPYTFSFEWNEPYRIHDTASFADFCRRNNIRYWIVGCNLGSSPGWKKTNDIAREYVVAERLVAGCGETTIYDVAGRRDAALTRVGKQRL